MTLKLSPSKTGEQPKRSLHSPHLPSANVSQANMPQFIYTSTEIPNVGEVSLGWYNVPSGSPSAKHLEERAEIKIEPEDQHSVPTGDHADDDVYEDDEGRWLPE
jgi:hypothetical protein